MALTDLVEGVRRLARPLALGLAVYGCGGAEPGSGEDCKKLGDCYDQICPNRLPEELKNEINQYCTPERVQNWQQGDDCLFIHCLTQAHYCIDPDNPDTLQGERDPNVLNCMESYGWVQCEQDYNCSEEHGEHCVDNRCK